MQFGERLDGAMRAWGPLCVGIDPHPDLLARWGLPDTAESLLAFGDTVIEASARSAAAVKPNAAFFERHGARGIAALEQVLANAREQGLTYAQLINGLKLAGNTLDRKSLAELAASSPAAFAAVAAQAKQALPAAAPRA